MESQTVLTLQQLKTIVSQYGYDLPMIRSILSVETSGIGFSRLSPYHMIIRFEPTWFKKEHKDWAAGQTTWMNTGAQNQTAEWKAFNIAAIEDKTAAQLSTSIGIGQLMGFNCYAIGFKHVQDFWDYCQISELNQVDCMLKWIKSKPKLHEAVLKCDYDNIAFYYNGPKYKELADKNAELPYNVRLHANRNKFLAVEATGK
jgi:hypothetical protein